MAEEKTPPSSDNAKGSKPKAKKEKPPKLEDKPFAEFMEQHFVPQLDKVLKEEGWEKVELSFEKAPLAVKGATDDEAYWQVKGDRPLDIDQQFSIVFAKEDIKGPKFFYYTQGDVPSSTVEQFMGDERRITLDLMVLYTVQRLNGQKWLTRN